MIFAFIAAILNAAFIQNVVVTNQVGLEAQDTPKGRLLPMLMYAVYIAISATVLWLISYPLYTYVLVPLSIEYLDLLVTGFVLIGLTQGMFLLTRKFKWQEKLPQNKYVILNTALLYIVSSSFNDSDFSTSFSYVFGSAVGFVVVLTIYQSIVSRLSIAPIPKAFKGLPIILILLGLLAIALSGIGGIF